MRGPIPRWNRPRRGYHSAVQKLRCRPGIGGQAEAALFEPHGHARPRAENTIDCPDVMAARGETALKLPHGIAVEAGRGVARVEDRGALKPRREIGGGEHIGEALVPLEEHVEIGIGDEGRARCAPAE